MLPFKKFESEFLFQFSLVSLVITLFSWDKFVFQESLVGTADWLFPLSLIPPSSQVAYWLCFGGIVLGFAFPLFIKNKWAAVILPIVWLFALAFEYSFGKIDHSKHCFFFLSLGYLLTRRSKSISIVVPVLIASATFGYLSSGLWKLRALLAKPDIWESATLNLPHHIAYGIGEGSTTDPEILKILVNFPNLSGALWLGVVCFEILAPILSVIYGKAYPGMLLMFLAFHLGILLILGINFLPQMVLLVWLVLYLQRNSSRIYP